MWDLIPSWLADPSAYAQPENLDMTTVAAVALANLCFGLCCLGVYETVRRRQPRTYAPRAALGHATPPMLPTRGIVLNWVAPLMRLDEEQILAIGGYDVLVYLRFIALPLKVFGSFAPYALVVLLPVNLSASYKDGPSLPNLFTRLSMAIIPEQDPRLWAHFIGIAVLTFLTFHWLGRECRWYTRLRHRFLAERKDARVVFVRRLPPKLRGSKALGAYFEHVYPGKIIGAVGARRCSALDALVAARDAARLRAERLRRRRAQHKGCGLSLADRAHARLEDVYDPLWWRFCFGQALDPAARLRLHDERGAECDDRLGRERQRAAAYEPLVADTDATASPDAAALVAAREAVARTEKDGDAAAARRAAAALAALEGATPRRDFARLSSAAWEEDEGAEWEDVEAPWAAAWDALRGNAEDGETTGLLAGRKPICPGPFGAGFVGFHSLKGAAVATQVFHAELPGGLVATPAPEPRDVIWRNIGLDAKTRATRGAIADCAVVLLLVFYVVPVTLVAMAFSEAALRERYSWINALAQSSFVADSMMKTIQPMALVGIMLLLPPMFLGLGVWQGCHSWTENTLMQLSRYYSFQIINVLLVTTISGSLINCIEEILEDPSSTFSLLGGSLPRVCAFFCCYVFMKAFAGLPLELCRGVAAAQQTLKRLIYPSATHTDRGHAFLGLRDIAGPGWFSYGKYGAQDLLVVIVMMIYSIMSPVVLVPGLLFFGVGSVVYRHQLLFVYEPLFESGGLLWPRFYRRILFSVFLMQFTMVGLFFSKRAYMQGYLTLALSALTYLYQARMKTLYTTSSSVAHHLPMELASRADEEAVAATDDLSRYVQPALRPDDDVLVGERGETVTL